MRLSKQIVQLWVAVQEPQKTATSNHQQLGSERDSNVNLHNSRGYGRNQNNGKGCVTKGIKCFQCDGWGHWAHECQSTPLNGN